MIEQSQGAASVSQSYPGNALDDFGLNIASLIGDTRDHFFEFGVGE